MDSCPVFLRGEIDLARTADVINQLRRAAARQDGEVVVDCCDITFIDVVGVEARCECSANCSTVAETCGWSTRHRC